MPKPTASLTAPRCCRAGWIAGLGISLLAGVCWPAAARAADGGIGVSIPTMSTPFWQAYLRYVDTYAKQLDVKTLAPMDAGFDLPKQLGDIRKMLDGGAAGILAAPLESGGISPALKAAASKHVPVISVDVAPTHGPVAMVVRVDNRAFGQLACTYISARVKTGVVVQIMGDLASVNGRDRAEGFRTCMKAHANLKLLEIPAEWRGDQAAKALDGLLALHSDISGIYMASGGVYLEPTLATLQAHKMLAAAGKPGHVILVANDGSAQEFAAIRRGDLDATVAQPADMYAKYGLIYLKQAMAGQTFKPGPTDHASTIVEVSPGVLEDQLSAPLVTIENVDDKSLWGNQS